MKKSLHPATIVVVLVLAVAAVFGLASRFTTEPPAKSTAASPYKIGEMPTSPGSGVNSITGEPLSESAKADEIKTFERLRGRSTPTHP